MSISLTPTISLTPYNVISLHIYQFHSIYQSIDQSHSIISLSISLAQYISQHSCQSHSIYVSVHVSVHLSVHLSAHQPEHARTRVVVHIDLNRQQMARYDHANVEYFPDHLLIQSLFVALLMSSRCEC